MKLLICLDRAVLADDFSINENAIKKIRIWLEAGADVEFLTKKNTFMDLKKIDDVLKEVGLGDAEVHKKMDNEKFQEVIEKNKPHLFIDCRDGVENGVAVSDQLKKDFNLKKIILNSGDEMLRLPDLPEELKDYVREEQAEEK